MMNVLPFIFDNNLYQAVCYLSSFISLNMWKYVFFFKFRQLLLNYLNFWTFWNYFVVTVFSLENFENFKTIRRHFIEIKKQTKLSSGISFQIFIYFILFAFTDACGVGSSYPCHLFYNLYSLRPLDLIPHDTPLIFIIVLHWTKVLLSDPF